MNWYIIVASLLIAGGIIAIVVWWYHTTEKKNLKKFPPGTGEKIKGTKVTVYERLYQPADLLWEYGIPEKEVFYRYTKEDRKVRPGESHSPNDVAVTITLEYWLLEPATPTEK